jgi:hypothetical protein
VGQALKESGFLPRLLNVRPVPFPSHGNQRLYRAMLRGAVRKARLLE